MNVQTTNRLITRDGFAVVDRHRKKTNDGQRRSDEQLVLHTVHKTKLNTPPHDIIWVRGNVANMIALAEAPDTIANRIRMPQQVRQFILDHKYYIWSYPLRVIDQTPRIQFIGWLDEGVYREISKHLDTVSVVSLAITCRGMRFHPGVIRIVKERKRIHTRTRARAIEKDVARVLLVITAAPYPKSRRLYNKRRRIPRVKLIRKTVKQLYRYVHSRSKSVKRFESRREPENPRPHRRTNVVGSTRPFIKRKDSITYLSTRYILGRMKSTQYVRDQ